MRFTLTFLVVLPVILHYNLQAQAFEPEVLLENPGFEAAYPRLLNDEQRILYQGNESGRWQLYIFDIKARQSTPVFTDGFNNNFPDIHPNNNKIAFVSDRDGNEEIYICNANGSGLKRLTNNPARDIHPYFSPDGKYIFFNSTSGNGSFDVFRYNLTNDSIQRLSDYPEDETCARYAADMSRIVFLRNGPAEDDVYMMKPTGFMSENVTRTPQCRDGWPVFSADVKWIYYSSMEEGRFCIFRKRTNNEFTERLTQPPSGQHDARVYVSASGKWLIFNRSNGKTIAIMRQPLS